MEKYKIVVCDHIHEEGLNLLRRDDQIEMIFAADMDKTALLDVVATAGRVIPDGITISLTCPLVSTTPSTPSQPMTFKPVPGIT